MEQDNSKKLIMPIIAIFMFALLVFTAGYAYFNSSISNASAAYQVNLPKQTSLICTKTDCSMSVTITQMASNNYNTATPKGTSSCYVNCTCSGSQGAVCEYDVAIREATYEYIPSSGIGSNKEYTVTVTNPSGCTQKNSSGTEAQTSTRRDRIVSTCSLTVPASGSVSANVAANFKWYNLNLDQNAHAGKTYQYKIRSQAKLPSTYQAVEYITFAGAQQINTGIQFNPATDGFDVSFKASTTDQNGMILGSSSGPYMWVYYYQSGNRIGFYTYSTSGQLASSVTARDVNKHVASYSSKQAYMDGVLVGNWTSSSFATPNSYFFVGSYNGNYYFKGNIYYVTIYRNGTIIRDLIPVKRVSDSAVGMYDLANGIFYTNSGSGSLTAGPNA